MAARIISGPFRVRVGVRVSVRGWVGSTPVPLSDQEVLSARKGEQPTAPNIRAATLLGELSAGSYSGKSIPGMYHRYDA